MTYLLVVSNLLIVGAFLFFLMRLQDDIRRERIESLNYLRELQEEHRDDQRELLNRIQAPEVTPIYKEEPTEPLRQIYPDDDATFWQEKGEAAAAREIAAQAEAVLADLGEE